MPSECTLRDMTSADLELVLNWRNSPVVRTKMFNQQEITEEQHQDWFVNASADFHHKLLIVQEDVPFGFVQFKNVQNGGVVEWGFFVDPEAPRGSGIKLGCAALNYAFVTLKVHKICGQALQSNHASVAFHKRLGFVQEGLLRQQKIVDDVYHTIVCFGLLKNEWNRGKQQ